MPFFEEPPPPPFPQPDPDEPYVPPIWTGPSVLVLGHLVPINVLLAKTDEVAVVLERVLAHPNGVELTVVTRARNPMELHMPMMMMGMGETLRFGVEFADGRKATNVGAYDVPKDDNGVPTAPVIWGHGGGGGGRRWDQELWLWPLPPPGPLQIVIEWPSQGIGETRHTVDGAAIVEAAGRAITLWDSAKAHGPMPHLEGGRRRLLTMQKQEKPPEPDAD